MIDIRNYEIPSLIKSKEIEFEEMEEKPKCPKQKSQHNKNLEITN